MTRLHPPWYTRSLIWAGRMKRVLAGALTSWVTHRDDSKGAALAFYAFFSLTPILVLAIAISGRFFGAAAAQSELVARVQDLAGTKGAQAIQTLLATAHDPAFGRVIPIVAGLLLLFGATSVFVELKNSLDELWGSDRPRQTILGMLLRTRLLSLLLVLVLVLLLLVSLVASAVMAMLIHYADGSLASSSALLANTAATVSFIVIAGLCAVIYKTLPDAPLSWRDAAIGATFTSGLFSLGKYAIGLYLGNSVVTSRFGAAVSLVALLLWVYYSAQIFFLGAEFTRQYALSFGSLHTSSPGVETIDAAHLAILGEDRCDATR